MSNDISCLQYQYQCCTNGDRWGYIRERSKWCREHCNGRWGNLFNDWYFEKEEDYVMFALRWS